MRKHHVHFLTRSGLDRRSVLEGVCSLVFRNGDHLYLILSQILVDELHVSNLLRRSTHRGERVTKRSRQKCHKCKVLPLRPFPIWLKEEAVDLLLSLFSFGLLLLVFLGLFILLIVLLLCHVVVIIILLGFLFVSRFLFFLFLGVLRTLSGLL